MATDGKYPLKTVAAWLLDDLTPTPEGCGKLLELCGSDSPRSRVEAGIAQAFFVHRAVLAATDDEEQREAILIPLHERLRANFVRFFAGAELDDSEFQHLLARRLQTYGSLLDSSLPDWQLKIGAQIFEGVSGTRGSTVQHLPVAMVSVKTMVSNQSLVKDILAKFVE